MKWDQAIEQFIRHQRAAGRPETTNRLRYFHLRHLAKELDVQPEKVSTSDLVGYLAGIDVATNTKRSIRTSLRAFFSWAHQAGHTSDDPSADLPTISARPGKPRPATDEAIQAALAKACPRVALMIRLAAYQGLRCREIAAVHTRDVRHHAGGWVLDVHGKGERERTIPLRADLAREIRRHPAGYVFPAKRKGHLTPQYVSRLISRALPARVTAHMLRHHFASTAYVQARHDIRAVQELLGHASVATTQVYTATPIKSLRRAVKRRWRALTRFHIAAWWERQRETVLQVLSIGRAPA